MAADLSFYPRMRIRHFFNSVIADCTGYISVKSLYGDHDQSRIHIRVCAHALVDISGFRPELFGQFIPVDPAAEKGHIFSDDPGSIVSCRCVPGTYRFHGFCVTAICRLFGCRLRIRLRLINVLSDCPYFLRTFRSRQYIDKYSLPRHNFLKGIDLHQIRICHILLLISHRFLKPFQDCVIFSLCKIALRHLIGLRAACLIAGLVFEDRYHSQDKCKEHAQYDHLPPVQEDSFQKAGQIHCSFIIVICVHRALLLFVV